MRIEMRELVHEYAPGQRALNGVDLAIEGTDPVAIIGQNGAGKTTLVKHFNGILRPTAGQVLIDGVDIKEHTTAQWSAHVGYVFQNPDNQLFMEDVRHEFEFGPRQIGIPEEEIEKRIRGVADLVGLSDKLDVNPADLMPSEKKFCAIGAVIMMGCDAVIFDEPTCGQDVRGTEMLSHIIQALRTRGKLCITISHDVKFVTRNFSKTVVMCQGNVLTAGDTPEVFQKVDLLRKSYVIPPAVSRVARAARMKHQAFDVDTLINNIRKERNSNE